MKKERAILLGRTMRTLAEGALYLWISAVILYGSPLSEVFNIPSGYMYMPLATEEKVKPLLWWLEMAALLCVFIGYALRLARRLPRHIALTIVAAALFSTLYLLDPLLSTLPFYFFGQRLGVCTTSWMSISFIHPISAGGHGVHTTTRMCSTL